MEALRKQFDLQAWRDFHDAYRGKLLLKNVNTKTAGDEIGIDI